MQALNDNLISFFDTTPVPMVLSRADGSFEYVNPALLALLGYEEDEIYAEGVIITAPEDVAINRRVRESLQADPFSPVVLEKHYLHKNGRRIPAMLTMVAQPNSDGEVIRFIAQVVDLSGSKRLEAARRQAEQRFRTMFEHAPVGMALCDSLTGVVYDANASYLGIAGRSLPDLQGCGWMSITHPDDLSENLDLVGRMCRAELPSFRMIKRLVRPDQSLVYVQLSCTPIDVGEASGGFHHLAMLEDITEFRQAQQELQNAAMVYQKTSESMMILDAQGRVVAVNAAFTARSGYSEEELRGKVPKVLDSDRYDAPFYDAIWQSVNGSGCWQGEVCTRSKFGGVCPQWVSLNAIRDENGDVYRLIYLSSDMTEKKAAQKLIWQQANFDSLTGLPNRDMFRDRLRQEIRKAQRSGKQVALFNLDLDRFKEVNDTLGHLVGDQLLAEAARRLSGCVRRVDTVARQGGDEFTVVMGGLDDTDSVDRVANAVLQALAAPFQLGDEIAYISISIGLTLYPRDSTDIDELARNADQAMYAAKLLGRNRFQYYTETMQQAAIARRQMIRDMHEALPGGQLLLYFQPIVCLDRGTVSRVEALLRWRHPQRGIVCPSEFVSIAEETRIIVEMGGWVFEEALREVQRLRQTCDPDIQVSINTSSVQYRDRGIDVAQWRTYLQRCAIPDGAVSVEISEGLLMSGCADVDAKLAVLREAGIKVVLENFGTGRSAISSLRKCEIDYLKIDRSFVHNLSVSSADIALCEAIIAMAHKMGIKVIAQGVETEQQHQILKAAGCDLAQGFWYAEPASLEQFENWYRSRHGHVQADTADHYASLPST
jgi:diguanylate cyclase (GGDEF)-like protein/PAS domain S-box-containing protein